MKLLSAAWMVGLIAWANAAHAEVVAADDGGFVTRDEAVIDATPKEVWLALISPAKWWSSSHTWSADSSNLTLKPQAGGCFCERIPEDPDPKRITLEGSVEHMRVIQAYPERALRMSGALGPLQSEPVNGVLTISISEVEEGTRVVWEYVVGGYMRYDVAMIAPAVDGVMSEQLNGLATLLGRVGAPAEAAQEGEESAGQGETEEREQTLEEAIDALADR